MKKIFVALLFLILFLVSASTLVFRVSAQNANNLNITVVLTVEGTIDTYDDDPNEFADPLYYIWIDANGNPDDGGYGNGQGSYQTGIQLGAEWTQIDSPRLHFWGPGSDGLKGTSDDENFYLSETSHGISRIWEGNDIEAKISMDGKSLVVTFPLKKIGSPNTVEVSFMTSTTTSTSIDNLDPTTPSSQGFQGWIGYPNSIDATATGSYSKNDATETISADFNIISGQVEVFESTQTIKNLREPPALELILPVGAVVVAATAFLANLGPTVNSAISNLNIPKPIKSFLKFYGGSIFSKVDKIKIKVLEDSPFLTKTEVLSLVFTVLLTTVIYGLVEANGFSYFLNPDIFAMVIPSILLSSGIIAITKVVANAFWAKSYRVYKQFSIWIIGLVLFIITGLLFLFPFSSPSITRYQSVEITKKTKAFLVMFKTFTLLTLLVPFSIFVMLEYPIVGDSGLLLTLMSTCYSLVPLKFLSGKAVFEYSKKISLSLLFLIGVLFYGCTLHVFPQVVYLVTGIISALIVFITQRHLKNVSNNQAV